MCGQENSSDMLRVVKIREWFIGSPVIIDSLVLLAVC